MHGPNRIVNGPNGQRHFRFGGKFAQAGRDKRIMDGQLLGSELAR